MKTWIHEMGQLNTWKESIRKWKSSFLLIGIIGLMSYMILFSGERLLQELAPGLTYTERRQDTWLQMEQIIMELVCPAVVFQDYYGYDYMIACTGNEIPSYYYQDEDTVSQETQQALEADMRGGAPVTVETSVSGASPGQRYTMEQLSDFQFLIENCYVVDSTTYVNRDEMNAQTLLSMDMTMQQDNSDYQILIYHTHSSSETFVDSRPGVLEDTPIGLGDTLTKLLEDYGYKVYHDRTVYDQVDGKIDRNYAYTLSGQGIDQILAEHPSIEVVIDLHRDGVNENTHLVTNINGKPTAKIMFFNGVSRTTSNGELEYLSNPNRQANLAFSLQMYLTGTSAYDDFLRRTYIKGYQYNLNRRPKATLIEVGGQTNTVEEANNAMEPLAYILNQVLSGKADDGE